MASLLDIPTEPTSGLQTFAILITFFFPALALVVIIIRDAGRLATNKFGLDDWLVSIAMLLSVAETVVSYFFIKTNFIGIHIDEIPPHDPTNGLIWNYAVQILYNPILALVKSSVLIFLLRLFGQKTGVRRFILGLNAVNLLQMTGVFFAILFQCFPIALNWDPRVRGRCVDQRILFTTTAAFNIFTDLVVLGLPLWIFSDLNIPRRTKIALLFVFLLGFLVTITSVVRMVLIVQGSFGLVVSDDPTFNIGFVTSAIETNLALITASAPALRPLMRPRARGGWLPSLGRSPDVEMASTKAYTSRPSGGGTGSRSEQKGGGVEKPGRSGSQGLGSRRGSKRLRSKRRPAAVVKAERELRSQSPRSSEEEAMTNNGIMRVSDIQREIDGLVKEMAVGPGSYGSGEGGGGRRFPAERYYSESIYPDVEYRDERDFNEERLSRYGDRRFGVVTPKATTAGGKWGGNGRPF